MLPNTKSANALPTKRISSPPSSSLPPRDDVPLRRDTREHLLVLRVDLTPQRSGENKLSDRSGEPARVVSSSATSLPGESSGGTDPPRKALKG